MGHIVQTTDWKKYSLDDWLIQLGAWIDSNRMQGGNWPDRLGVSQLWRTMREHGSVKTPCSHIKATCQITDNEARAVMRLLHDAMSSDAFIKLGIICLYKNLVEGKSLRMVGHETGQSTSQSRMMVNCGRSYLLGRYGFFGA